MNREEHSSITIFLIVAFAFFLKLFICVAPKVHFNFFKVFENTQASKKAQLRVWGPVSPLMGTGQRPVGGQRQSLQKMLTHFELPKLVLCLMFFKCFIQGIVLLNTSLTSMVRVFGYLFHLSSYMLNRRKYRQ